MLANRACGLITATAALTAVCLSPGLAPKAWAQAQPAADADAASEVSAALDLRARGAWSPGVNYAKDDLVTARGSAWRAKRANRNKVPGSTLPSTAQDWERFAAGFNPLGGWLGSRTYHRDDLVLRQGSTWRALRTNLNKTPGAFPADWQQFAAAGGNSVANGSAGAPSINFSSDPNTGIFSPSSGKIALVEDGALFLHNIGTGNTALGAEALDSSSGSDNTALGVLALTANTSGTGNTAVGSTALASNTSGGSNTALGFLALANNQTGSNNTAVGPNALKFNFSGASNIGIGPGALAANQTSNGNVAIGSNALLTSTAASNTAVGDGALLNITAGSGNIALGANAGVNPTAPSNSIYIGNAGAVDTISGSETNVIKIGTQGTQASAFIAGISGATSASGVTVLINSAGKLGTTTSSRRYKQDIQAMAEASAPLMKLRPVTFRYKQPYEEGSKPLEYGLIAEEVAEVLPELAVFNKDGTPETVKYHLLPALLLNEVQRQQRTIARQETTIRSQAEQAQRQQQIIQSQAEQMAALERRLINLEARLSPAQHAQIKD